MKSRKSGKAGKIKEGSKKKKKKKWKNSAFRIFIGFLMVLFLGIAEIRLFGLEIGGIFNLNIETTTEKASSVSQKMDESYLELTARTLSIRLTTEKVERGVRTGAISEKNGLGALRKLVKEFVFISESQNTIELGNKAYEGKSSWYLIGLLSRRGQEKFFSKIYWEVLSFYRNHLSLDFSTLIYQINYFLDKYFYFNPSFPIHREDELKVS